MRILIDSIGSATVEPQQLMSEGGEHTVLSSSDTFYVLEVWSRLDPSRRQYTIANAGGGPEPLIIAWFTDTTGLVVEVVNPFWDGIDDVDAYSLDALSQALPIDALLWGERAGEPTL